jgi:hypothetical protein
MNNETRIPQPVDEARLEHIVHEQRQIKKTLKRLSKADAKFVGNRYLNTMRALYDDLGSWTFPVKLGGFLIDLPDYRVKGDDLLAPRDPFQRTVWDRRTKRQIRDTENADVWLVFDDE